MATTTSPSAFHSEVSFKAQKLLIELLFREPSTITKTAIMNKPMPVSS